MDNKPAVTNVEGYLRAIKCKPSGEMAKLSYQQEIIREERLDLILIP
jgi:hypothetical protein